MGRFRLEHVSEAVAWAVVGSLVELPEGLAEMPPGPELAAMLASIDRGRVSGFDLVVLLRARSRQLAYEQAEFQADLVAVAERVRVEAAGVRWVWDSDIPELAAAEIAAALRWTRRAARARLGDACVLIENVPAVWAALRAGEIDLPRARVLAEGTSMLGVPAARRVVERILPDAPGLTTGQLAYRLRRLVIEVDPAAAGREYAESVARRKVARGSNPDGTAYLAGCNLPADRAAAADERLDALARAAKRAGDGRAMDHIRADIFLGLLSGTWDGPGPVARRGVVELTCDLPTLMGLADHAGELAGWGPVVADIAGQIAAAQIGADTVWQYSITSPLTGGLVHHGTTRRRPTVQRDPRREPTTRQRRFVVARDRTCRGVSCRVPARRTEVDHVEGHAGGGPTRVWNLDCKCGACHDLKDAGWQVHRNPFGDVTWTSLLGHTYTVPAEPITTPRDLTPFELQLLATVRSRT
ncbi:MAG TPA: DUF222 domain-containing protein [Streptosporangiaceae bacterium]